MSESLSHHSLAKTQKDDKIQTTKYGLHTERAPSNLNLRHNDNSFHVLASILVEFFEGRVAQEETSKTITLNPDDREILQRLLPNSAVMDFIDAVNYRLEVTPVIAVSPIHYLTLQCQELCFDQEDKNKNPILITYSLTTESVTVNILEILSGAHTSSVSRRYNKNLDSSVNSEENNITASQKAATDFVFKSAKKESDDICDGFVDATNAGARNSLCLSFDGSAIKVASNKDIAEEMIADCETKGKDFVENISSNLYSNGPENGYVDATYDGETNSPCVSVEGSAIKVASSKDIAEEMLAETISNDFVENISSDLSSDGSSFKIASSKTIAAEMLLAKEKFLSNDIEKPPTLNHGNEDREELTNEIANAHVVIMLENVEDLTDVEKHLPSETATDSDLKGLNKSLCTDNEQTNKLCDQQMEREINVLLETALFQDATLDEVENTEEGEEIEMLPTLSDSSVLVELNNGENILPNHVNGRVECEDLTIGEIMRANQDNGRVECEDLTKNEDVPKNPECGKVNCEDLQVMKEKMDDGMCHDVCLENKENIEKSPLVGDSDEIEILLCDMSKVKLDTSPAVESAHKTVMSIDSVSQSIQIATGNFFEDLRWAIDEKIMAFEDAVADAIVSKPKKQERQDLFTKQQAFENIVREQIPEVEPQKRMKSLGDQSGMVSFFAGIANGFSPSASEKNLPNGLTFPSDEGTGSEYKSSRSIQDLSRFDTMPVSDSSTKQQLLLEAKEAITLMNQSITPETKSFWRDHILSLQNRLDALRVETEPMDNIDSQNVTIQPLGRSSPSDMSTVRSVFGIPVVSGLLHFSDASLPPQDTESVGGAPSETRVSHRIPRENVMDWNQKPTSIPEIELCDSGNQKTMSHMDQNETGHAPLTGIAMVDSYYEYPLVDVVAPADLPGGYHFEAEIEGQRFLATVPPSGVQQGETFTCYMRELDSVAIDIPVGDWKDGLCNMCELGWCHPVLWNALFCPLIALGQIQTRVNLDFLGRPKFNDVPYSNRFMMLTVIGFWLFTNVGLFAACNLKWSHGFELSIADGCAFALVNVAMFGFVVFVTQSTRSSVREKFMIRERQCYDLEDVCCAAICLPCTVGQMSRHTANYDDYEAVCCSKSGLPNGVRVNQEPTKVNDTKTESKDGFMV